MLGALALAHLGRRDEAARVADFALADAEQLGAPAQVAAALHARAVAEPDPERRIALCERGLALEPGGLEAVRLRLELGAALAYVGRRVEARDALRPALADGDAFGAMPLSERARRELVATGLRPRQAALEGTAALTPRQRQICELAAVGKGNRVIAQELFLSIKTVETHLAAGYRKLGVNTRAELAAELAQRRRRFKGDCAGKAVLTRAPRQGSGRKGALSGCFRPHPSARTGGAVGKCPHRKLSDLSPPDSGARVEILRVGQGPDLAHAARQAHHSLTSAVAVRSGAGPPRAA